MSRLAYEMACGERDRVYEQLARANERADKLEAALVAIKRRDSGLPEQPRQPRKPADPMPADIAEYFMRFADKRLARARRNAAYLMNADGQSWDAIREKVLPKEEEDE